MHADFAEKSKSKESFSMLVISVGWGATAVRVVVAEGLGPRVGTWGRGEVCKGGRLCLRKHCPRQCTMHQDQVSNSMEVSQQ